MSWLKKNDEAVYYFLLNLYDLTKFSLIRLYGKSNTI